MSDKRPVLENLAMSCSRLATSANSRRAAIILLAGTVILVAGLAAWQFGWFERSPPTTTDEFVERLPEMLRRGDVASWHSAAEEFNARQQELFMDEQGLPKKEYTQLKLIEDSPYVVLEKKLVKEEHSDGIDGGIDIFEWSFFRRTNGEPLATIPGPAHRFGPNSRYLSVPLLNDCLDNGRPTGEISVHDVERDVALFQGSLPQDAMEVSVMDGAKAGEMMIDVLSEHPIDSPNGADSCEVGGQVRRVLHHLVVRCSAAGDQCLLKEVGRSNRGKGCQSTGACD